MAALRGHLFIRKVGDRELEALVLRLPDGRVIMPTLGNRKIYKGDL
ncbi:hypothetical protein ACFY4C_37100 [Actinomadura viridis]